MITHFIGAVFPWILMGVFVVVICSFMRKMNYHLTITSKSLALK